MFDEKKKESALLANKQRYCSGCENNFYNGNNNLNVNVCRSLKTAKVVKKK